MKIVVVVKTRGHFNYETIKGNKRIPNLFISSVGTRQSLIEFDCLVHHILKTIGIRISKIYNRFQVPERRFGNGKLCENDIYLISG